MHQRHSIICASYLLFFKENRVLLLRRLNTGYQDGKYSVPAGHVEEGESLLHCLIREAKEEVGLSLTAEDVTLEHTMHRNRTEDNQERLDFFFVGRDLEPEPCNCEPDKCDDLRWFPTDQLPANTIPYIKQAIEMTLNQEPYSEMHW